MFIRWICFLFSVLGGDWNVCHAKAADSIFVCLCIHWNTFWNKCRKKTKRHNALQTTLSVSRRRAIHYFPDCSSCLSNPNSKSRNILNLDRVDWKGLCPQCFHYTVPVKTEKLFCKLNFVKQQCQMEYC
jgi:hypothetical protein